jgi:heme oxygenase
MNELNMSTSKLSLFLRNLADKIDDETTTSTEILNVVEFYMKNVHTNNIDNNDFRKFVFLGWYMYQSIDDKLSETTLSETSISETIENIST